MRRKKGAIFGQFYFHHGNPFRKPLTSTRKVPIYKHASRDAYNVEILPLSGIFRLQWRAQSSCNIQQKSNQGLNWTGQSPEVFLSPFKLANDKDPDRFFNVLALRKYSQPK